jgi:two-component system response regulator
MNSNSVEILMVEDTDADAELATIALRDRGLANRMVRVKDGAEALDFLFGTGAYSGRQPDLPKVVLLDLRLPKVSGVEVLRQMKADPRTRAVPVVVLTSSQEDIDLKECYKIGVNSYITKPVTFDEFTKVVAEIGLYWLLVNKLPDPFAG